MTYQIIILRSYLINTFIRKLFNNKRAAIKHNIQIIIIAEYNLRILKPDLAPTQLDFVTGMSSGKSPLECNESVQETAVVLPATTGETEAILCNNRSGVFRKSWRLDAQSFETQKKTEAQIQGLHRRLPRHFNIEASFNTIQTIVKAIHPIS